MNQTIMQSHATEKIQKVQQQHPDMQQRYFSLQLQEEKRRQGEKIADAEEAKKKIIDAKQEKKQEHDQREAEKAPKNDENENDADDSPMTEPEVHHIDIKA